MELTSNILSSAGAAPELITNWSPGSVTGKVMDYIENRLTGSSPAHAVMNWHIVTSTSQLKTKLNTFSNIDISQSINLPIPDLPISVSGDNSLSISNQSEARQESESGYNSMVLEFKQVFYTLVVSPTLNQTIFKGENNNTLPDDLLYVSSVNYGQVFYLTIQSKYSKKVLYEAVKEKINAQASRGINLEIPGFPIGFDIGVNAGSSNQSERNQVFSSSDTKISVWQVGGKIERITSVNSIESAMDYLKGIPTTFNKNTIGEPISFTLSFAKDHSDSYINYDMKYATTWCGNPTLGRYDVALQLVDIEAVKVVEAPGDNMEDLYGQVYIDRFKFGSKNGDFEKNEKWLWKQSESKPESVGKSGVKSGKRIEIVKDISYEDLVNGVVVLDGQLYDWEPLHKPEYRCDCEKNPGNSNDIERRLLFNYQNTIESIGELKPGEEMAVVYGEDNIATMNFYENG